MALYFENVSETALFFSSLCACTFFFPVAVLDDFLVELLLCKEAVRPFFLEAPPRKSDITFFVNVKDGRG